MNDFLSEATQFLTIFGRCISDSAAHLYPSCLPFLPSSSKLYHTVKSNFQHMNLVAESQNQYWPTVCNVLQGHSGWVESVCFSPDGKFIASGSSDETLRIWDAGTGKPVGEPLVGHSGSVQSVCFSPDGKFIASGSDDKTLRISDINSSILLVF